MDNPHQNILFSAIRNAQPAQLQSILAEHPELVNGSDERGITPLVLATYTGNLDMTRQLVEAGADLNASGKAGTALMGVCFKGFAEIAKYLIEAGADVDARADNGSTALHFAAMFNQEAIVDLLIRAGADAGARDAEGLTAGEHAQKRGFGAIVAKLG